MTISSLHLKEIIKTSNLKMHFIVSRPLKSHPPMIDSELWRGTADGSYQLEFWRRARPPKENNQTAGGDRDTRFLVKIFVCLQVEI